MIDAPAGKPYAFLPFAAPVVDTAPPHDRFEARRLSGWLELRLQALTAVSVLSGRLVVTGDGEAYAEMASLGGRPCLPGSSVKGVVRSVAEVCSASCAGAGVSGGVCARRARRACPACRIFGYASGAVSYRSRVRMDDFVLAAGHEPTLVRIPQLFAPRGEVYQVGGRPRGRKFYFHGKPESGSVPLQAAGAGAAFTGRVYFEDLDRAEAGLLFFALGLDGSFDWKLGHAKPAYLGSLRPTLGAAHFVTQRYGGEVGTGAEPVSLAREYAENGCGWSGAPTAVAALREVLGRSTQGPPWHPNPRGGTARVY